jgi:CxxC-x17-CxxC domain-containing protein
VVIYQTLTADCILSHRDTAFFGFSKAISPRSMTTEPRTLEGHRVTSFVDKTLICSDCGAEFVFTAGEQEFHASKGFTNEPRRCPTCRSARKQTDGRGGGGGGGGYGGGAPRQMFTVTCGSCGKPASVPFEPRGDRPVYCNDCFQNQPRSGGGGGYGGGGGGGYGGGGGDRGGRGGGGYGGDRGDRGGRGGGGGGGGGRRW